MGEKKMSEGRCRQIFSPIFLSPIFLSPTSLFQEEFKARAHEVMGPFFDVQRKLSKLIHLLGEPAGVLLAGAVAVAWAFLFGVRPFYG